MIPQVGGFQGCYLDNHRNNWRCARAVPALCENAPVQAEPTGQDTLGFPAPTCPLQYLNAHTRAYTWEGGIPARPPVTHTPFTMHVLVVAEGGSAAGWLRSQEGSCLKSTRRVYQTSLLARPRVEAAFL